MCGLFKIYEVDETQKALKSAKAHLSELESMVWPMGKSGVEGEVKENIIKSVASLKKELDELETIT